MLLEPILDVVKPILKDFGHMRLEFPFSQQTRAVLQECLDQFMVLLPSLYWRIIVLVNHYIQNLGQRWPSRSGEIESKLTGKCTPAAWKGTSQQVHSRMPMTLVPSTTVSVLALFGRTVHSEPPPATMAFDADSDVFLRPMVSKV